MARSGRESWVVIRGGRVGIEEAPLVCGITGSGQGSSQGLDTVLAFSVAVICVSHTMISPCDFPHVTS